MFDYTKLKVLVEAQFGSIDEFAKVVEIPKDVLINSFLNGQVPIEKIDEFAHLLKINDAESLKACFFCHKTS